MALATRSRPAIWARRLGWLALLWTASVAVLALVAILFRLLMNAAGMTV
ncbi:hypothetical protein LMIY3S_03559 [Labrys miyagiensis]